MRTSAIELTKICPSCGGLGHSEAKLPMSANRAPPVFNLDDMDGLVSSQGLSLLLALVELLPYKLFTCGRCQTEFKMESQSTKELVQAMLMSMRPVVPAAKPARRSTTASSRARTAASASAEPARKRPQAPPAPSAAQAPWEAESLDALFDYHVEEVTEETPTSSV